MNAKTLVCALAGFVLGTLLWHGFSISRLRSKVADMERKVEALSYRVDCLYKMEGIGK